MTAHEESVKQGLALNKDLADIFSSLGSAASNGLVTAAFSLARSALRGRTRDTVYVRKVLEDLRRTLQSIAKTSIDQGASSGINRATRMLRAYSEQVRRTETDTDPFVDSWMMTYEAQMRAVMGLSVIGDEALILGDASRSGALTPGPMLRDGHRWIATAAILSAGLLLSNSTDYEYQRQAIAAIDERTTDCCLRVNGQCAPWEIPFQLTGTPRFADQMLWSPFHYSCRTAVGLVHVTDLESDITQQMREAAQAELRAREESGREEITPAFSFSGRG